MKSRAGIPGGDKADRSGRRAHRDVRKGPRVASMRRRCSARTGHAARPRSAIRARPPAFRRPLSPARFRQAVRVAPMRAMRVAQGRVPMRETRDRSGCATRVASERTTRDKSERATRVASGRTDEGHVRARDEGRVRARADTHARRFLRPLQRDLRPGSASALRRRRREDKARLRRPAARIRPHLVTPSASFRARDTPARRSALRSLRSARRGRRPPARRRRSPCAPPRSAN